MILVFLVGCATEPVPIAPTWHYTPPPPKPVPEVVTYTWDAPRVPPPPPEPIAVDCQDQKTLAAYGFRKEMPICLEGTEAELPTRWDECYWSLARGADGSVHAPSRECHPSKRCHMLTKVARNGVKSESNIEVCE